MSKVIKKRRRRDALTGFFVGFAAGAVCGALIVTLIIAYCLQSGPL